MTRWRVLALALGEKAHPDPRIADRVAPSDAMEPRNSLPMAIECQRIRAELLAIAAELDAE